VTETGKINPLSRRPKSKRLVVAVRGAAGTGKSHFAASLADAGVGRLCLFDVERKARLLPDAAGPSPKFDALEVHHPDELPDFIEWALDGEGRQQGYGSYALDSWTMYFGRKHRQTLAAVREATGDPTAEPTADQLQADQLLYQEVLRRLCIDSGGCVVITDQIAAKGREEHEENEMGRVLPMTLGGLEYFVDVLIELRVEVDGFEQRRVARVVKSNSPHFPIGLEIENPVFADLLARMDELPEPDAATDIPDFLKPTEVIEDRGPGLDDLIVLAERHEVSRDQLLVAARHYHRVERLDQLENGQIRDLLGRLKERYGTQPKSKRSRGAAA
jgi:hypothetical protein